MKNQVKEILTENREMAINFYNEEIKGSWNISLKDFMIDVMTNFKKVTKKEIDGFRKYDVHANLTRAKGRLGLMDRQIEVDFDIDKWRASKAPNDQWIAII